MSDEDKAGGRYDLLNVLILPIPTLDLVGSRLPEMHAVIKPQRLDDERSGSRGDAEAILFPRFHARDEVEDMRERGRHVLTVFSRAEAVKFRKLFSEKEGTMTGNYPIGKATAEGLRDYKKGRRVCPVHNGRNELAGNGRRAAIRAKHTMPAANWSRLLRAHPS